MPDLPGSCCCHAIEYRIRLDDPDADARTSICHCNNCKKFTGGNYGITTKIRRDTFQLTRGRDQVRVHEADNGSGVMIHREFCGSCGGPLLEYGVSACLHTYLPGGSGGEGPRQAFAVAL